MIPDIWMNMTALRIKSAIDSQSFNTTAKTGREEISCRANQICLAPVMSEPCQHRIGKLDEFVKCEAQEKKLL